MKTREASTSRAPKSFGIDLCGERVGDASVGNMGVSATGFNSNSNQPRTAPYPTSPSAVVAISTAAHLAGNYRSRLYGQRNPVSHSNPDNRQPRVALTPTSWCHELTNTSNNSKTSPGPQPPATSVRAPRRANRLDPATVARNPILKTVISELVIGSDDWQILRAQFGETSSLFKFRNDDELWEPTKLYRCIGRTRTRESQLTWPRVREYKPTRPRCMHTHHCVGLLLVFILVFIAKVRAI